MHNIYSSSHHQKNKRGKLRRNRLPETYKIKSKCSMENSGKRCNFYADWKRKGEKNKDRGSRR